MRTCSWGCASAFIAFGRRNIHGSTRDKVGLRVGSLVAWHPSLPAERPCSLQPPHPAVPVTPQATVARVRRRLHSSPYQVRSTQCCYTPIRSLTSPIPTARCFLTCPANPEAYKRPTTSAMPPSASKSYKRKWQCWSRPLCCRCRALDWFASASSIALAGAASVLYWAQLSFPLTWTSPS